MAKTVKVVIPGEPGGLINLRGMIFKTGEPVEVPAEIAKDFKLEAANDGGDEAAKLDKPSK
jgi:hypothetical protein